MKKHRAIFIIFIGIAVAVFALVSLTPSLITHIFFHSKKEIVRHPQDIENALLALKNQKQDFNAPHLVFEIPRKSYSAWNWFFNWKSARVSHAWADGDRIIEFVNVGGTLVYSIPIRWREDNSAGPVVSKIETNVSPPSIGTEIYSTSDEEYKRLTNFFAARTPGSELSCSISKDAAGRVVKDIEYFNGTLSLPQNEWADSVQSLFKQVYNSDQPICVEQIQLRPLFGL